jgi:hypothetical protein
MVGNPAIFMVVSFEFAFDQSGLKGAAVRRRDREFVRRRKNTPFFSERCEIVISALTGL